MQALTALELSAGNYDAVRAAAARSYDHDRPSFGNWALPQLIEAATRLGDDDAARQALERLSARAVAAGTPWGLGLLARSRALVADDEHAESHYRDAIARLEPTSMRPDLARAHLLYGEWLRRQKRRVDAREQLRVAHEMFSEMGAAAFAERARLELAATGEHARGTGDATRVRFHPARSTDRPARRSARDQPRDRRRALHQPQHRRLPPAQGVPESRCELAARPESSAPRPDVTPYRHQYTVGRASDRTRPTDRAPTLRPSWSGQ